MSTTIVQLISDEEILASVNAWTLKEEDSAKNLILARDAALRQRAFDENSIPELIRQVELGNKRLREITTLVINALSESYSGVAHIILRLVRSKHLDGRLGAVYCLSPELPDDFLGEVLTELLIDKSKKVREMTLEWVVRNRKNEFLPLLKEARERENDAKTRQLFSDEITLLEKGYIVDRSGGKIYVTVMAPLGRTGAFVELENADELSDEQIATIFRSSASYLQGAFR